MLSPVKTSIAFVRYKYDPYGGAERFTDAIVRALARDEVDVHIFARKWTKTAPAGVTVHPVGGPTWPSLVRHAFFVWQVDRALTGKRFDLIQSNERTLSQDIYRAGDGVHARWLELRCKGLTWARRLSIHLNPFHRYMCRLERRLFENPRLRAVIVNSKMVRKEILARFKIPEEFIHVIYNGVDLDRFHPANRKTMRAILRKQNGAGESTFVVLLVGSGFERKGLEPLMRAFAAVPGDTRLWVVGKGSTLPYERIAGRLGIMERTKFFGPREEVIPFYAGADIFALPTLYDPFPNVILEAMASGLPVITTAQCGAAEIIRQGREGFVVESPQAVDAIRRAIERMLPREVRRVMGKAARERAEAFPMEETVRQTEKLYRSLLNTPS